MVRKAQKSKAKTADSASNKSSKGTGSKKPKSADPKLSNGYDDNQNQNTENKTDLMSSEKGSSETQANINPTDKTENTENVEVSEEPKENKKSRKRKNEEKTAVPQTKGKRQKVLLEIPKISSVSGKVFVIGSNDCGQLGFSDDVSEKTRPALLELSETIVDIAAGGMHSVCLTERGEVITFGCNDEGALGRITTEETERTPQKVDIPERIVQISVADSHTAALSEFGQVYVWGNFRNGTGSMGLVSEGVMQSLPVKILNGVTVVKISSGSDHLVCLSQEGIVYSCGCGEAGQLGRFTEHALRHGVRDGRSFISTMISPDKVLIGRATKSDLVDEIWTGSYSTFARVKESGAIYGFGLNNYGQLGLKNIQKVCLPKKATSFNGKQWMQISGGQHHSLSLDDNGLAHSFGRSEDGRLGLGGDTDKSEPTVIPRLENETCIDISCGNTVSYAVTNNGAVYSWGFGETSQLGHGNDSDQTIPKLIEGNFFKSWKAVKISGGGQHTLILANPREKIEESQ